jgi:shikimate kinase
MTQHPHNIALIGMMGSGKSTVGKALADRLGWSFVDTDAEIVTQQGRQIADIFAADGEEAFRDLESATVLAAVSGESRVIATGGGAVLREENRAAIWGRCRVVWLSATAEEHAARVSRTERRPVLERYSDPVEGAGRILAARTPLYSQAHHTVDTTVLTVEEVVESLLAAWQA